MLVRESNAREKFHNRAAFKAQKEAVKIMLVRKRKPSKLCPIHVPFIVIVIPR